ncbi:S1 RNA-binding domain-containing protein [Aliikangiella sp. G2MR2-5]|uniref:CvfB family protein n=1 Tax=Aliikangiella sp. G2MR2-5 TaxID=2788943 RepID=UPI0018A8F170|nr:S1-like domain-containing RNA-binding protein [Aliikangiella sp. G2MR2-5]
MAKLGQFNFLKISRKSARGTFFETREFGQVFLPAALTPGHCEVGDKIRVFLYRDTHDNVVATTLSPRVEVGGVACLKVVSVSNVGAFLDWGLPKDLFVPFAQQVRPMREGEFHIVYLYEDNTGRICGSSKLNRVLKTECLELKTGDAVKLIVGSQTDLGYKMIVNEKYWGVLHKEDVFRELRFGQSLKGFIKKRRDDNRLDITLNKPGSQNDSLTEKILASIDEGEGFSEFNDKTAPELIYSAFGVSKKVFKAALGTLYKERKIVILKDGIRRAE